MKKKDSKKINLKILFVSIVKSDVPPVIHKTFESI